MYLIVEEQVLGFLMLSTIHSQERYRILSHSMHKQRVETYQNTLEYGSYKPLHLIERKKNLAWNKHYTHGLRFWAAISRSWVQQVLNPKQGLVFFLKCKILNGSQILEHGPECNKIFIDTKINIRKLPRLMKHSIEEDLNFMK